MTGEHRVALVVDPDFGDRLEALSRSTHVWVRRSSANEAFTRRLWGAAPPGHSSVSGLTLFGSAADAPEQACSDILHVIWEHHGHHSHHPALSRIDVYGVSPTVWIQAELATLGFDTQPSADGFVVMRRVDEDASTNTG